MVLFRSLAYRMVPYRYRITVTYLETWNAAEWLLFRLRVYIMFGAKRHAKKRCDYDGASRLVIYIDTSGQDETNTIMRAELAAIHVALDNNKDDTRIGIVKNSQTSLQAKQNLLQRLPHTR